MPRHSPIALTTLDRSHDRCPPSDHPIRTACSAGFKKHSRFLQTKIDILKRPACFKINPGLRGQAQPHILENSPMAHKAATSAPSAKAGSIFSSRCSKRQARSTKASRKQTSFSRTVKFGGASRDRTDDLKLAKLPLSQLSYGPVSKPLNRTQNIWWAWKDLNFRPHAYQARALTN
jgi:hypothetical protein